MSFAEISKHSKFAKRKFSFNVSDNVFDIIQAFYYFLKFLSTLERFIEAWQKFAEKNVILLQTNEYRRMGCVHDGVPRLWYCCRTMLRGPCPHCQMRHVLTLLRYCSELCICFKSQFTNDDNWRGRHEKGIIISITSTFEKTVIKQAQESIWFHKIHLWTSAGREAIAATWMSMGYQSNKSCFVFRLNSKETS